MLHKICWQWNYEGYASKFLQWENKFLKGFDLALRLKKTQLMELALGVFCWDLMDMWEPWGLQSSREGILHYTCHF